MSDNGEHHGQRVDFDREQGRLLSWKAWAGIGFGLLALGGGGVAAYHRVTGGFATKDEVRSLEKNVNQIKDVVLELRGYNRAFANHWGIKPAPVEKDQP